VPAISFENHVVIVTGAGGALGRTYALDIARRGGAVVVNDLGGAVEGGGGSREPADQVAAEIRAAGGKAIASYDSVETPEGARRIAAAALDAFGRIDALINNAGNIRNGWLEDASAADLDAQLQTHVRGAFNVTQAVWPQMKAQRYGRVVFTSSAAGMLGNPTQSAYGAAKAGVAGLMNALAQEGEAHGILCNALTPNAMSRMGYTLPQEVAELGLPYIQAFPQAMDPAFTTGIVVYLASEACTSTHAIYSSLGGRIARVFVGVTHGWQGSREQPASAEDIATHIAEIRDPGRGFNIPRSLMDEYRIVAAAAAPEFRG
jgi:NAD(P)-dependent dehydrogenase (short-subunit alcohol dehydrogenase family)